MFLYAMLIISLLIMLKQPQNGFSYPAAKICEKNSVITHNYDRKWVMEILHKNIKDGDAQKYAPKYVKYLEDIETQARRCKTIVQNLLRFSRTSRTTDFTDINANQVIEDTLTFMEHQLHMNQIDLEIKLDENIPLIQGNSSQLQQVLTNLVINAMHASPEDSKIKVLSRFSPPLGEFSGAVEIVIIDEGCGISQENVKKIIPLDWDQSHNLYASVTYIPTDALALSMIGRLSTGYPYSPYLLNTNYDFVPNSGRKPTTKNVDIRISYRMKMANIGMKFFVKVYNLFDTLNERYVFNDTGKASYTFASRSINEPENFTKHYGEPGVHTYDEYNVRPQYYRSPRSVRFGVSLDF